MKRLPYFSSSPQRVCIAKRCKQTLIARFPVKSAQDYLDYTVDFSRQLRENERIVGGVVRSSSRDLRIEQVYAHASQVIAFISAGVEKASYYLTFIAKTTLGSLLTQDGMLCISGNGTPQTDPYAYRSWQKIHVLPKFKPPLNALKLNYCYILNPQGLFMV